MWQTDSTLPDAQHSLNPATPSILHIDLNSCFATVEQQARPLLRGRPLAVTNRLTVNACVARTIRRRLQQSAHVVTV